MANRKTLVTGGGGFLGRAIVERLLSRGDRVRVLCRGHYDELRTLGVEVINGDIRDCSAVIDASSGCELIFHVAAKAGIWGDYRDYYETNFTGTCNVLSAQRVNRIPKLVYTSSPSVVFAGKDMAGVNESVPYPGRFSAYYPKSKALAEREVLRSANQDFATVALRPHLIWGPRDNHLVPRIIARSRSLRKIGTADPLIDCTYIDNAAEAHIIAADRLAPGAACCGKAYFISNGEPRPLWNIINAILDAAGCAPVSKSVPLWVATPVAIGLESVYKVLRIQSEPRLTRFLLGELTHAHWFDISAARRDLGYIPRVSIEEGMLRLRQWLQKRSPHYAET